MVAIVDVGISNVASVVNILDRAGSRAVKIAREPKDLEAADGVVLPGVGHFDQGMRRLRETGFVETLQRIVIRDGRPTLGICLGMQLMFEGSDEGTEPGLGWLPGRFTRFPSAHQSGKKVPHMGWNWVDFRDRSPFALEGQERECCRFYFVHSYHLRECPDHLILATTEYGHSFVSAVLDRQLIGVQFHPEKSHRFGVAFIRRFLTLLPRCA